MMSRDHTILAQIMGAWRRGEDLPADTKKTLVAEFDCNCAARCNACGSHDVVFVQTAEVHPNESIVVDEECLIGSPGHGTCQTCGSRDVQWGGIPKQEAG